MIPSRSNRFYCNYFEESPAINYLSDNGPLTFLSGMRSQESVRRSGYKDIWKSEKWGEYDWTALLPIRQWFEPNIWLYILSEDIEINDKYRYGYDRVGYDITCPNYIRYTWALDKYQYPYLFNRWKSILRNDFINNNKRLIINHTVGEYVTEVWASGVCRDEPTEEVISEFSQYSGLDIPITRRYFNRYYASGCINKHRQPPRIEDRNALVMSMRMFGRNINYFSCKRCLMREFGWSKSQWDEKVNGFKEQGCQSSRKEIN